MSRCADGGDMDEEGCGEGGEREEEGGEEVPGGTHGRGLVSVAWRSALTRASSSALLMKVMNPVIGDNTYAKGSCRVGSINQRQLVLFLSRK
jgi:hypothetical protein